MICLICGKKLIESDKKGVVLSCPDNSHTYEVLQLSWKEGKDE